MTIHLCDNKKIATDCERHKQNETDRVVISMWKRKNFFWCEPKNSVEELNNILTGGV